MSRSASNLPVWCSFVCVIALPLVLLAVVTWMARPAAASITRSELVLDDGRPSWENNLNWFVDGNIAVEATPLPQHDAASSGRTRSMHATMTEAGFTHPELGRPDADGGASALSPALAVVTFIGAASVLACVTLGTSASPVVTPGPVLCGLGEWLEQRNSRNSERTCAAARDADHTGVYRANEGSSS